VNQNTSCRTAPSRDSWPLVRLLAVLATLGLWAHWRFAWVPPPPTTIQATVVGLFVIFAFCGFLSITLARLYVALLFFPIYATTKLNVGFYELCYWCFRTALRLLYMRRVSAVAALAGELGLFIGLLRLIELVIRRYL
jgi:hypothetical protein